MKLVAITIVVGLGACGGKAPPAATPDPVSNAETTPPSTPPAPPANDAGVCAQRSERIAPVTLTDEQAGRRYGLAALHFADAPSSLEHPIEVCMVSGEQSWLVRVTCADGSRAQAPRSGSVGGGGLCGSIIDHYVATCPEQTYEVYMDMYMCAPGEDDSGLSI